MADYNPGADFGWGDPLDNDRWGDPLDNDIRKLVEMVTELGINVEDILNNAFIALLGMGAYEAFQVQQAGKECDLRYQLAHQFGINLIMSGRASADQTRWIMELQQLGETFRLAAQDATWIAIQALELAMPVEDVLVMVGSGIQSLDYLARETREQVRDSIVFSASRERRYARQILERTANVQRTYNMLESRVQATIREYPQISFPMQQLLGIAARMAIIDRTCIKVATSVLSDMPTRYRPRS